MALEGKTVFTDSKDFTLTTIKDMFDDGEIITNPDYVRRHFK